MGTIGGKRPPAEELAELVAELVDEVRTDEAVTRYQEVRRGGGRTVTVVDPKARHTTRDVGLLHQLHAIKSARRTIPVRVYRWESDHQDDTAEDRAGGAPGQHRKPCHGEVCPHGRWVHLRTEQRPAWHIGAVSAGAALPGGSPGWDESGALNPLRSMGFESAAPATTAVEMHDDIRRGVDRLRRDLRAETGQDWGGRKATAAALRELVGLLPDVDEATARWTVARVRGWVSAARIMLGYDAPIVRLRDVVCGICEGDLHVRADASTAVWCAGHRPRRVAGPELPGADFPVVYPEVEPCGERYPRGSWIKLLERAEAAQRKRG